MSRLISPPKTDRTTVAPADSFSRLHVAAESTEPRKHCNLRAFIFDVDGVLADTAGLHAAAWRRLAEEEHLSFHDDMKDALRGLSRRASLERLLNGRTVSPDKFEEMMARKNQYYVASLSRLGPEHVLSGSLKLINGLRRLSLMLAAASVSRNARRALRQLELIESFDAVIDGDDLANSRSDLNQFALAAAALHIAPDRCVAIEDSTAGIAAARQLGMKSVGIGDPRRLCAANLVFESLQGVTAESLFHWLSAL